MLKKIHFWLGILPFVISLSMILFIMTLFKFLPPKLPLFYSLTWGEKQLATHQQFLILPTSIILVTFINLIISWQLHHQQSFFKKALLLSSVIVSLILTITFIKIVLLFI